MGIIRITYQKAVFLNIEKFTQKIRQFLLSAFSMQNNTKSSKTNFLTKTADYRYFIYFPGFCELCLVNFVY